MLGGATFHVGMLILETIVDVFRGNVEAISQNLNVFDIISATRYWPELGGGWAKLVMSWLALMVVAVGVWLCLRRKKVKHSDDEH
jgi:hypothetical protein